MVRLLFVKLGSNPETRPIVENIRSRLGDCFIAGVEETLDVTDSVYDEVLTSHDDALFGAFSKFNIDGLAMNPALYEEVRLFEGQGLRMIERLQYYPQDNYKMPKHTPRYRDSFQSRSDLFYRYCLFWNEVLTTRKFDAVVAQNLAHMAWDFSLEKLCVSRQIPFLFLHEVGQWPRNNYIHESVDQLGQLSLGRELKEICKANWQAESEYRVRKHLARIKDSSPVNDPFFEKWLPNEGKAFKTGPIASILRSGNVRQNLNETGDLVTAIIHKVKRLLTHPIQTARKSRRTLHRAIETSRVRRTELRIASHSKLSEPFVYFPLHFQPEASTGSKGRHFVEQREAVALIAGSLPPSWHLVVKEHPHQYRRLYPRNNFFWQRLAAIPKVVIVPHFEDNQELINRCEGVVSISHSTVATEAWITGSRVVFLGHSHLSEAPGVAVVETTEQLQEVWRSPKPQTDPKLIESYLKEVEDSTVEGTLYGTAWYLPEIEQTKINQRTQNNVTELILAWLSTKGLYNYQ